MLATEEIKRLHQDHSREYAITEVTAEQAALLVLHQDHSREYAITGRRLADFLTSVEAEELLLKQRICDGECAGIRPVSPVLELVDTASDPADADGARQMSPLEQHDVIEAYGEF